MRMIPNIDTGPQVPQISFRVWKSQGWRDFARTFPFAMGGLCLFIGILVLNNPRDAHHAPMFFVIAAALVLTIIPLCRLGKGEYRIGFDRKTDTLWISRQGKIKAYEENARKIRSITFSDYKSSRLNNTWYVNQSMPLVWHKREWLLAVYRSSSAFAFAISGSGLATKQEAMMVTEGANELLRSLG